MIHRALPEIRVLVLHMYIIEQDIGSGLGESTTSLCRYIGIGLARWHGAHRNIVNIVHGSESSPSDCNSRNEYHL